MSSAFRLLKCASGKENCFPLVDWLMLEWFLKLITTSQLFWRVPWQWSIHQHFKDLVTSMHSRNRPIAIWRPLSNTQCLSASWSYSLINRERSSNLATYWIQRLIPKVNMGLDIFSILVGTWRLRVTLTLRSETTSITCSSHLGNHILRRLSICSLVEYFLPIFYQ